MKKYLSDVSKQFEKDLNIALMDKSADDTLVHYVVDACKSLEVEKHIKFVGYEYTDKESEIDVNKHIYQRTKRARKNQIYPSKFIHDSRVGRLRCHFEVGLIEKKKDENGVEYEFLNVHRVCKDILIPIQDENGLYQIGGKKYYLIYQMVEKSTYTSSQSVTLKSLMPVSITRNRKTMKDVDGNEYTLPYYSVKVFNKQVPVIYLYLSKGFDEGLSLLGVYNYIDVTASIPDEENRDPNKLYFELSPTIYVSVHKKMFEDSYIKSIIGGLKNGTTNRFSYEDLFDVRTWIRRIPGTIVMANSEERGRQILSSFDRLLDETTKKILKVHDYHKTNIYAIVRWMMQNFNKLRLKDNMDLSNKRLRCAEYIASLLTLEFSNKLSRIMAMGKKAQWANYNDLFKFSGDIILQKMHSSGVLRFDDAVNDMDFFTKFKYTSKGPHSLGNKNVNNISVKYRDNHPSFIGNIDCFVCGSSDPGLSGSLSPFGKINGLYFDESDEPDTWAYDMAKKAVELATLDGVNYVKFNFSNSKDYYNCLLNLYRFNNSIQMYGTSREGDMEVVIEEEVSPDEKTAAIPH